MQIKRFLILMMVAVMVFLTACGGNKTQVDQPNTNGTVVNEIKDGGTIIFAIGSDPNVLNPLYAGDRVTMTINNALFAPLYVIDEEGTHFFLAESITPSEDYLTYTLKLKEGIKWHDGEKITADDIVFTIESLLDPAQNSHLRDSFIIDGKPVEVVKVDESTVEFKLPQISMPFISNVSKILPIPKHVFEREIDLAKSDKNASPIGSGPFKFKDSKSGEKVELVRFDEYFDGKAHLDSVVYRVISDPNAANIALQNGELSARYIDPKDAAKFEADPNLNVVTYNEGMLNNMVFNLNNDTLKNKDVRKAIAYAINKEEVIVGAYESTDYAEKAYSVFVPNTTYYTDKVEEYNFDENKAKELLANAGAENLKLKLAYINSNKAQENQGLIMQHQFKNVGIELELIAMERGAFYQKLLDPKNKDFDLAYNGYVMGSEPDGYKGLFTVGSMNNFMNYENLAMDELWNKAVIEKDEVRRGEIYTNIQEEVIEDMVVYPIAYPKSIVAINAAFGGIEEAKPVPIFMFRDLSKLYMK
ncbi:ABC transporter substrate-binding protein [Alkaliphilus sp. MSJ-5]|uniref:ABC transporter substrate-binding protein n=1 Tax=Alkaliphilus flagellatus TaxID=2841507 RepID=A0ABS6G6Z4_9FIRM|nr:ABC transporter substrate-binding protein [Alkaliphilus flagellatus]MBU5677190.1 ABC transporter substrate-binding protein [Alkaliphilus flagellatus]